MRAKFIKGKDPKDTIGVGRYRPQDKILSGVYYDGSYKENITGIDMVKEENADSHLNWGPEVNPIFIIGGSIYTADYDLIHVELELSNGHAIDAKYMKGDGNRLGDPEDEYFRVYDDYEIGHGMPKWFLMGLKNPIKEIEPFKFNFELNGGKGSLIKNVMETYRDLFSIKESYSFERGEDPKKTMRIGKAGLNPFLNGTFRSMNFWKYLQKNSVPNGSIRWEFLKIAAELLNVKGSQVLVATDSKGNHLDQYDLREMGMDDWENSGEEIEINDEWYLAKDINDVVYVIKTEEGERFVLGKDI